MFSIRFERRGSVRYLRAEFYETAVLAAQALADADANLTVEIWSGSSLIWKDNCPIYVEPAKYGL
jgi:hypothetical protein